MTYTEHDVTGTDAQGNDIGDMHAIASWRDQLILLAQPSQDVWSLNPTTFVATEIGRSFGPHVGITIWQDHLIAKLDNSRPAYRLDSFAEPPTDPNTDIAITGHIQAPTDPIQAVDVRDNIKALASDGVRAWALTTSYLYQLGGSFSNPTATLVGAHHLRGVTGACWWMPTSQILCATDRGLIFLDPATLEQTPTIAGRPAQLTSITPHQGQLYGTSAEHLYIFDTGSLVSRAAQLTLERDRWEIRLRQRKNHRIEAVLTEEEIIEAEFNQRAITSASGRLRLHPDALVRRNPDLLIEMTRPSASVGGLDIEFYREHPHGTDQLLYVVGSINFGRGATTNISVVNVGDIYNSVWVLGDRTTGTGGANCRRIVEVGDEFLIAARGINQGDPIDASGATQDAQLEARGRAFMEDNLRKLEVDESLDFSRSQRVDRMDIYLDDIWTYFARRYSNPGTDDGIAYSGASAGEYIASMVNDELRFTPPGFDPNNERNLTLDIDWEWARRNIGELFNVRYPRTRMLRILEEALLAGGLVLHYELSEENILIMTVREIRDRSAGDSRIVLTDAGEALDVDSVLPGDRVERELIVGDISLGITAESRLTSTTAQNPCGTSIPGQSFTSADATGGILVLQRQIKIDGMRGLQTKLSTGDIVQDVIDVRRSVVDLSQAARVR